MLDINSYILTHQQGALGVITLNRPEALNATNYAMVLAIDDALRIFADIDDIKHVVIRSNSDRAYCAGGDIRDAYMAMVACDWLACAAYFHAEYQLTHRMATFPKPIYAFVNGICLGGGMGISAHCTARIAGERALFGMPETTIGFFPDVGAAYFYNQFKDQAEGMYWALTGRKFDRNHAMRNGIATHAIDEACWDLLIDQLAAGVTLDECDFKPAEVQASCLPSDMLTAFSHDSLDALIEALPAETLAEMRTKSPLSIAVTHAYMKRARGWTLQAVLEQDFALALNFVRHGEFREGVRALLIDKDKRPQWRYAWQDGYAHDAIPEQAIFALFESPV